MSEKEKELKKAVPKPLEAVWNILDIPALKIIKREDIVPLLD